MDLINISFEVKKIFYHNEKTAFTIASVKIINHPEEVEIPTAETVVRGIFQSIYEKDEFEAEGKWIDTGRNGYQFQVKTSKLIFPETAKGIVQFLQKYVKGVGKKTATKIVERFKEDTLHVIREGYESLSEIKGISEKKAIKIHEEISKQKDFEEVLCFLLSYDLNYGQAVDIYSTLGYGAIEKIKENPYMLCSYSKLSFNEVDSIAKKLKYNINNKERVKASIIEYINYHMKNRGDLFVYKPSLYDGLLSFLDKYSAFSENKIKVKDIDIALNELKIINKIKIEFDKEGDECIYVSYYHHIEDVIVSKIISIIEDRVMAFCLKGDISAFIKDYELKSGLRLASLQEEAVYMAILNRISILSGGPGTGKTQTINTIIKCIQSIDKNATIKLAAPTGRAAKRMTELTGMEAQTIHRLIGLNNLDDDKGSLIEVDSDFLIIDESSMIDAYVFYSLLNNISEKTRIIIVGDHEQLPSVGPGLILRDLIDSKVIPTTLLTEIFRQAGDSQIVTNSHRLINGIKSEGLSFQKNKGDFYFIENRNKEMVSDLIIKSIDRLLKRGYNIDDIQVLSVMNKSDLGVIELNKKIQKRFSKSTKTLNLGNNKQLKLNDRVMQTVNNYDLEVFNGEVGKITSINIDKIQDVSELEVEVDYEDKTIIYNLENIHEITLAYAMTVHKSQGSEFDVVIMPIHSSLEILLNRNIIYTAWTRAKKRVVLIGDKEELDKGIDRIDNTVRNSLIKDKLISSMKSKEKVV